MDNKLATSWFDIETVDNKITTKATKEGEKDIQIALERITKIVEEEIGLVGGDSRNVYIGGNSQGLALALHFTLMNDKQFAGFMGFIGWKLAMTEIKEANKNIPIFVGLDLYDPFVPYEFSMKSLEDLKGMDVKMVTDEKKEHKRSPKMNLGCQEWIEEIEKNRTS